MSEHQLFIVWLLVPVLSMWWPMVYYFVNYFWIINYSIDVNDLLCLITRHAPEPWIMQAEANQLGCTSFAHTSTRLALLM